MESKNSGRPDGLVLAGGAGRRIGGAKATRRIQGIPLAVRAIELLRPHCGEIVVAGRRDAPLPDGLGVPVVYDDPRHGGPVAGVAAGLGVLTADEVLVLACDLPLAGAAVGRLAAQPAGHPVVAVSADGVQPLCARLPRVAALTAARELLANGAPSARGLVDALDADRIPCPDVWLANVNTPEDADQVAAVIRRAGRRGPPNAWACPLS